MWRLPRLKRVVANVYADLGGARAMVAKAGVVAKITAVVQARGWRHCDAARLFGIAESEVSQILGGQFRAVSEAQLKQWLNIISQLEEVYGVWGKTVSSHGCLSLRRLVRSSCDQRV